MDVAWEGGSVTIPASWLNRPFSARPTAVGCELRSPMGTIEVPAPLNVFNRAYVLAYIARMESP